MHEPLKNRTYLEKKIIFQFLGAGFVAPKSGQRREKQRVLEPALLPAREYSKIYLQLCIVNDYHVYLIASDVIIRLLLDKIFYLWGYPMDWLLIEC